MDRLSGLLGPSRLAGWRRRVLRRLVAAALLALAALVAVGVARPAPPATSLAVVAARDLPAGTRLTSADVTSTRWPSAHSPPAALTSARDALGQVLATPLAAGEPVTTTRLATLTADEGRAPAHVLVADPRSLDLLTAGSRVTVWSHLGGPALAEQVPVLALDPPSEGGDGGLGEGIGEGASPGSTARGAVLALDEVQAERVFAAARPEGGAPVVLLTPSPR